MPPWSTPRLDRTLRLPSRVGILNASGRLTAFAVVEVGAEAVRRGMLAMPAGPLSSPTGALLALILWTYLAHSRYAFRSSPHTGLATLPPFLAAGLAAAVGRTLADTVWGGALADLSWAGATVVKYLLVRAWAWPGAFEDATR